MKTNITKTSKTFILAAALMVCASISAFAQDGRISAGIEIGVPIGDWSNFSSVGIGASAKYEAPISTVEKLNWTAQLGFLSFSGKDYNTGAGTVSSSLSAIPLQGGLKYYFMERNAGFYASADLGLAFLTAHAKSTYQGTVYKNSDTTTKFAFAPGVGYQLANLDFGARFQLISDVTYFNIRAAYVF